MTRLALATIATAACVVVARATLAQEASVTRCDAVLTQEEAVAIVGDSYQGPAVDEPSPGFTRCEWQGSGSNFGFTPELYVFRLAGS